jgi:transposase
MNQSPSYFVGIDVSKNSLDFALFAHDASPPPPHSVSNDPQGHRELIHALRAHDNIQLVVLEATGRHHRAITHALEHAGLPVVVANPKAVRRFAGALGITAKTDRLDAQVIARFAAAARPTPTPVKTPAQEHAQNLLARHRQLTRMRAAERVRRHEAQADSIRQGIDQLIAFLTKHIRSVESELDQLIQDNPQAKAIAQILRGVEGVGPATARTLLTHLPELGRVSRQRIAALVGVAPFNDDSGTHRGRRCIQGGRTHVRSVLYMATLAATRAGGVITHYYQHLQQRGKPKKYALTACMRKLLLHLNALLARHLQQPHESNSST